jgi:hypothetical protein
LELLKEGVNLTFEFRDDELEEPLKFTFIHGMAFIFTTTAIEELSSLHNSSPLARISTMWSNYCLIKRIPNDVRVYDVLLLT